jgi:hypothetical protein
MYDLRSVIERGDLKLKRSFRLLNDIDRNLHHKDELERNHIRRGNHGLSEYREMV